MHFTQKMMYMGFGCLLTLAGYILASMNNDSVAQFGAEGVTFGEIACRKLTVVDGEGKKGVELYTNEHGGLVVAEGKDGGSAQLYTNEHGGLMAIYNKGDKTVLQASVGDTSGGIITTYDKLGYRTRRLP